MTRNIRARAFGEVAVMQHHGFTGSLVDRVLFHQHIAEQ